MASDAPPLQLSDIMVHLSPSPETLPGDASARSRSPTPDTLNEHDLEDMRRRALEIREILSPSKGKESARENELLRMVLQVTSSAIPLKSQVLSQAETIAQLAQQRQLLLGRIEEERERWDAEREDWSRLSEALVTQTNKLRNGIRESTKLPALIESENSTLKHKLMNTQSRLASLEAELAQLRPILLMQPYALAHSSNHPAVHKLQRKSKVKEAGEDSVTEGEPSTPRDRKHKSQYYRHRDQRMIPHNLRKRGSSKHGPTLVDARSEHLLLAARKIGRDRASLLSSTIYQVPIEKPPTTSKGKGRTDDRDPLLPHPATPKTPQKSPRTQLPHGSPGAGVPFPQPHPFFMAPHHMARPGGPGGMHPPAYAFVPGPVPGPAYAYYSPAAYAFAHAHGAPAPPTNAAAVQPRKPFIPGPPRGPPAAYAAVTAMPGHPPSGAKTSTPSPSKETNSPMTPFDKLLSAATDAFSPSRDPDTPTSKSRRTGPSAMRGTPVERRADPGDPDDSPTPKRRRVQHPPPDVDESPQSGRRASALDVLADQALVFGSNPASSSAARSRSGSVGSASAASVESAGPSRATRSAHKTQPVTSRKRKRVVDSSQSGGDRGVEDAHPGVNHARPRTASPSGGGRPPGRTRDSRGSLEPPITLSRASTPSASASARFRLRPIQDDEFGIEQRETPVEPPRNHRKRRQKDAEAPKDREEDFEPESEEDQNGEGDGEDEDQLAEDDGAPVGNGHGITFAKSSIAKGNDDVHKRWLEKLGLANKP